MVRIEELKSNSANLKSYVDHLKYSGMRAADLRSSYENELVVGTLNLLINLYVG